MVLQPHPLFLMLFQPHPQFLMLLQTHQKTFWGETIETKQSERKREISLLVSLRSEKKIKVKIGGPTKKNRKMV